MLHYIEQMYGSQFIFDHYQLLTSHNIHELTSEPQSICWVIPYFPESVYEYSIGVMPDCIPYLRWIGMIAPFKR